MIRRLAPLALDPLTHVLAFALALALLSWHWSKPTDGYDPGTDEPDPAPSYPAEWLAARHGVRP